MTTKLPSIPNFDGTNIGDVLSALTEATQVRVGVRGDALDAGVTFRDLAGIGLVQTTTGAGVIQGLSARVPIQLPGGEISPIYDGAADLTTPPVPTELKAVAVFDTVFLSWNVARFANPSYYEIFRAFENNPSIAQLAGTSTSQLFTDIIGESRTLYYWVRTVSMAGVRSALNSSFGTEVKTGVDPKNILPILERQILESALSQELATRINDTNDQTLITSRGVTSLSSRSDALEATVNNSTTGLVATRSALINNYYTKSDTDSAIASSASTVTATFNSSLANYPTTVSVQQNFFAKADGQALQGQYTVKIDNNGHVSGFGLASTLVNGTPTSAFIVRADKFAIVDPATQQHGLNTLSPIEDIVPFAYTSGSPGIPEGVYIKQARIKNGDITDAKIGSVSAKKLTAGFVRATIGIDGAKVYGAELYSGGQTTVTYGADGYPSAFTASNPTVAISNGNAEFVVSNFKIRHPTNTQLAPFTPFEVTGNEVHIGTAFIKNGTIGIAKIEDVIKSTNYDISTTGWKLTKTGAFDLKNGTITAGLIQSTDGKMRIDLSNGFIRIEA
jgi:hypothetical protein